MFNLSHIDCNCTLCEDPKEYNRIFNILKKRNFKFLNEYGEILIL